MDMMMMMMMICKAPKVCCWLHRERCGMPGWKRQVERYYWKMELIKERSKELSESVIELPKNAIASDDTSD